MRLTNSIDKDSTDSPSGNDDASNLELDSPSDDAEFNDAIDPELDSSSWNGFSDPVEPIHDQSLAEVEKNLRDIDKDMTDIFERNRYLDSAMEVRKQKEQEELEPREPEILSSLFEVVELEAVLSRNDKAQGLDPRLIIQGKRRPGQKP
jgi:hypothetical protein